MQVSIIIVNYNTKDLVRDCLKSIYEQTENIDYEVIVSDNGSSDGSIEMIKSDFPSATLIENNANIGFGRANNKGLASARGKYILYLNSDTVLKNNAVKMFYDYFEANSDNDIGAIGCNLLNSNGEVVYSGSALPIIGNAIQETLKCAIGTWARALGYLLFKIPIKKLDEKQKIYELYYGEIENISGADLFLRNDENAEFDENFFLYCEDTDICFRFKKLKKRLILIDGPEIVHFEGASAKRHDNKISYFKNFSSLNFNLNRVYLFKKHGANPFSIFALKMVLLMLWFNPLIFPESKKYIKRMLSV